MLYNRCAIGRQYFRRAHFMCISRQRRELWRATMCSFLCLYCRFEMASESARLKRQAAVAEVAKLGAFLFGQCILCHRLFFSKEKEKSESRNKRKNKQANKHIDKQINKWSTKKYHFVPRNKLKYLTTGCTRNKRLLMHS